MYENRRIFKKRGKNNQFKKINIISKTLYFKENMKQETHSKNKFIL